MEIYMSVLQKDSNNESFVELSHFQESVESDVEGHTVNVES